MSYPIRFFESTRIYFLTSRCFQSRLLMRPSTMTNELIEGVLARAVRLYRIELYAFVFTSNHFHLMASADSGWQLARFMQFLQSNIARKVGKLVGWRGSFFERRYAAEPVIDDAALEDRLRYILAHGVKEGLVNRCEEWPGASCLPLLKEGGSRACVWRDWTCRWHLHRAKKRDVNHFADECPQSKEVLKLAALPCWRGSTDEERRDKVSIIVDEIEATVTRPGLGATTVLAQNPLSHPMATKRTKRPKCHASTLALWQEFVRNYAAIRTCFAAASAAWRKGKFDTCFPAGVFRPPLIVGESFGT